MLPGELEPEIAAVLRIQKEAGATRGPLLSERIDIVRARHKNAKLRFTPQIGLPIASIKDVAISVKGQTIPARVIRPEDEGEQSATVIYYHGGAFAVGDLDTSEANARRIANRLGAVVVNVGYRLAPEHRFPAQVDDAFAAYEWVRANIGELGRDIERIAVAGDSAGGTLALSVAIQAAELQLPLRAQLLAYPLTDLRKSDPESVRELYLGPQHEEYLHDERVSPVVSEHLNHIAPCVIGVGDADFLFEDNVAFAARLQQLGVHHIFRQFKGLPHGYMGSSGVSSACESAAEQVCADLKTLLDFDPPKNPGTAEG